MAETISLEPMSTQKGLQYLKKILTSLMSAIPKKLLTEVKLSMV